MYERERIRTLPNLLYESKQTEFRTVVWIRTPVSYHGIELLKDRHIAESRQNDPD